MARVVGAIFGRPVCALESGATEDRTHGHRLTRRSTIQVIQTGFRAS